jgi:hypothetical protein
MGAVLPSMALIRRFAVNLPKRDSTCKWGIKNKRLRMAHDTGDRNFILFSPAKARGST